MKKNRIVMGLVSSLFLVSMTTGCGSKSSSESSAASSSSSQESTPQKRERLKVLELGKASGFAVLAYSNITSVPNSSISGKVGLMPGTHDMIKLSPSEVAGGAVDIMAADDETTPPNLLSNAKVDMVSAYGKAASLTPDADKINVGSSLNAKKLSPGVYRWNGDLAINDDFTLEGSDSSIWIFQVAGHLKISEGVKMIMNGGARTSNIFWQVAGGAALAPTSELSGTIVAQQFITLSAKSVLNGRAFVKNGFVSLNQASINRP